MSMNRRISEVYHDVVEEAARPPSFMVALLPEDTEPPGVTDVLAELDRGDLDLKDRRVAADRLVSAARWELELEFKNGSDKDGHAPHCRVWLEPTERFESAHLEWAYLTDRDIEAAKRSRWSIGVSAMFDRPPLEDYHRQLKLLSASAPQAMVFYDVSAGWPRPAAWLRDAASSPVPPSPDNLYCVHVVHDEKSPKDRAWIHTHGLARCGSIELEILDVSKEHSSTLCSMLNATAALCMEHGPPPPDEPFPVGQDLVLVWLPWEKGIRRVRRRALGRKPDRDLNHSDPSGVLFVPVRRRLGIFGSRFASPELYLPILEDNPLLYVSNMETERMRRLAAVRLDRFLELQHRFGSAEDWLFLVKLGYPVDGADSDEDREHLWFELHEVSQTQEAVTVDATLLNRPYSIARMEEGQRDRHSLNLMSDWAILSPHGRFDPDTVVHLERILAEHPPV